MLSIGQPFRRFSQVGLFGAVLRLTGCTYLQDRFGDARHMLDVGVKVSSKPGLSLYADFLSIAALGYGRIIGMGDDPTGKAAKEGTAPPPEAARSNRARERGEA